MKTFALTLLALLAFAGNSVLCRLALKSGAIDAGSFTVLRLTSGALVLFLLMALKRRASLKVIPPFESRGSWLGGFSLFIYAVMFSYAYINLSTATGALILFGVVQVSLIIYGVIKGQMPSMTQYFGFTTACLGLVYLLWPELSKPSVIGLIFMVIAGIAWATYTVQGHGSNEPLADTAYNFLRTLPMLLLLAPIMLMAWPNPMMTTTKGAVFALLSGVITSGIGYALWYAALKNISNTTAAVSQLSVPILAAVFGLVFAKEGLTSHLLVASGLVLGGALMVILAKRPG